MTLQSLLDAIKKEGRLEGDTGEDDLILNTLNELYTEATEQQKIPELKVIGLAYVFLGPSFVVDLPVDYLKLHRVAFVDEDGLASWTLDSADGVVEPAPPGYFSKPKMFDIVGQQLFVSPSDDLEAGDTVLLDYYRMPPLLDNSVLNEAIVAPRLAPFLIRSTLARIKVYHEKMDQAAFHAQGAQQGAQAFTDENKATSNAK